MGILKKRGFDIVFLILNSMNLFILPLIAFYTMSGDKTDIIMGFAFGLVPLGWFLISVFYGIAAGKVWFAPFCTMALCLPLFFVRVITGQTIVEKILAMILILTVGFLINFLGALLGRGIRCAIATLWNRIRSG